MLIINIAYSLFFGNRFFYSHSNGGGYQEIILALSLGVNSYLRVSAIWTWVKIIFARTPMHAYNIDVTEV